jgi:hypothetical protein
METALRSLFSLQLDASLRAGQTKKDALNELSKALNEVKVNKDVSDTYDALKEEFER